MGEEVKCSEVSKQRITAQLKSSVKALQASHVRDRTSVVYRLVVSRDVPLFQAVLGEQEVVPGVAVP